MITSIDLINKMSIDIGLLPMQILKIIKTAPLRYKQFTIPKRNGAYRLVAQPAREVKEIQRWLIYELKDQLPIHEAATAYMTGASIKKNAQLHAYSNYLLKMDIKDFFPSILAEDILKHLIKYCSKTYDNEALGLMAYACTWTPNRSRLLSLCIGAPSSVFVTRFVRFIMQQSLVL